MGPANNVRDGAHFVFTQAAYIAAMQSAVRNNTALSRFELDADGETAVANYRLAPGTITFTHTEVAPALRGRGIGSALIRGALEAARTQKLKVVARCSFVAAYIRKNPEFSDLLG
jgi:predicted GNAT family acetyltransferase